VRAKLETAKAKKSQDVFIGFDNTNNNQ